MGTGWRRAFCTTIPRDNNNHNDNNINNKESSPPPTSTSTTATGHNNSNNSKPQLLQTTSLPKLGGLFSGAGLGRRSRSTPSTPRLHCRTTVEPTPAAAVSEGGNLCVSPKLQCKTTPNTPKSSSTTKTPKPVSASNPSSPRSPFSIFKNSLRLSRNNCGVCLGSVKTGQKMAIFTGECAHSFHFPCITGYAKKQSRLVCPVCNSVWKDVSLLTIHKLDELNQEDGNKQKLPKMTTANVKQETNIIKRQNPPPNIKHLTYNDDEPLLLSPTSSGGFVPIPEAYEIAEDSDDEFKGFFVNPISSTSNETNEFSTNSISNRVAIKLLPDVAIVSVSRTNETYAVVLKVKAPPPAVCNGGGELARRAPVDLVTVLDVGGSMTRAKLQMLKRAMRLVIASLGSADRLSIIAFSASAKRLLALKRMTAEGQRSARKIIDRLEISRGSCAGDGLRKATRILEDRRERNPVASVMLLSDGQEESVQSGNSNQRASSNHVSSTRFAHVEIPVGSSSFGKKAGYGHEPDEDSFAKCVGGLLSVVVQDLRIQLGFAYGSDPGEISAVYSCNGRPTLLGSTIVRLGDLYAEEERELLLELRVPVSCVGSHLVLSARCSYKDPTTQDTVYSTDEILLVPRPQAVRSSGPKIERLRNMFVTRRAVAESRRLIEHNELHSAQQLLASTRALLMQSSTMVLANEYIRGLEAELAEIEWRQQYQEHVEQQRMMMMQRRRVNEREVVMGGVMVDENGEPLTPTSAWRAAERLAKVASVKRSMNKVSDLHGFENARF